MSQATAAFNGLTVCVLLGVYGVSSLSAREGWGIGISHGSVLNRQFLDCPSDAGTAAHSLGFRVDLCMGPHAYSGDARLHRLSLRQYSKPIVARAPELDICNGLRTTISTTVDTANVSI